MVSWKVKEVKGFVRGVIPEKDETIFTDFPELEANANFIDDVKYYYRAVDDCPFARGNWIIDIELFGNIFALKLPLSMHANDVIRYIKPLRKKLDKKLGAE